MVSSEAEAFAHPAVVARLAGMAAEIDSLRVLVAALEAESVALRDRPSVPLKTPENSSVPPAKGFKADRAARRRAVKADGQPAPKRGPKPGHRGLSRSRVSSAAVDVIVPCRPERCRHCGHGLPAAGGTVVRRKQVIELPHCVLTATATFSTARMKGSPACAV